ncbi:hypothetical protein BGZ81_002788, partial [Podila clonocystis]
NRKRGSSAGLAESPATWSFLYDTGGVYRVTLTGPTAGEWRTVNYKFNISGPIPNSRSGTVSDSPGSEMVLGLISGLVRDPLEEVK